MFVSSNSLHNATCGERGIRTLGTLLRYTRFPGEPVQPLLHLSKSTNNIPKRVILIERTYNLRKYGISITQLRRKLQKKNKNYISARLFLPSGIYLKAF
jgi:hypothetical protein